tara:strand:- start:272 stop:709 length:438 start_codon:yes stop_codon:yes gene_type:complete
MKILIAIIILFSINVNAMTINCTTTDNYNNKTQRIFIIDNKDQADNLIRNDGSYLYPYGYVTDGKLVNIYSDGGVQEQDIAIINRNWSIDLLFFMDGFTIDPFETDSIYTKYFSVTQYAGDKEIIVRVFYPQNSFLEEGNCIINK